MGIDYMIDLACKPKEALTVEGLMVRLKGRERAARIIELYRDQGDQRPPADMGFEMVRRLPDGSEEAEVIVVQDLLDMAQELNPWEGYCEGCPANHLSTPFGCTGYINYPLTEKAEQWLLDQLPDNSHPLPFLLLQKAVREMGYQGTAAAPLRDQEGVFFSSLEPLERNIDGFRINSNQVFELLFLSGPIRPAHATMLLQFFGGLSPDLDADTIMQLAVPPSQEWIETQTPFQHQIRGTDDASIVAIKQYLWALYTAYRLGVMVLLDV